MDFNQSFAISAAGMTLERTRVDVAAINLANANTLRTANGGGFQPLEVVARTGFANQVEAGLDGSGDASEGSGLAAFSPQFSVVPSAAAPRTVYEPQNPFADAKGFVTYPGVDTATEMVSMMRALRAYEANVAAMNMTRTMALKALDIGGAS